MQSLDYRIEKLNTQNTYWTQRVVNELGYAMRLNMTMGGKWDALLCSTLDTLEAAVKLSGGLTREDTEKAEAALAPMAADAKSLHVICVGHAHIDMNWMWSYQETVAITLETFRTVLRLMDIFPTFTFAQSQASTYRIVEQYEPQMLAQIKQRVAEGRWEVSASTWVEADKNMSGSESMARHLLYTRKYLEDLLDLTDEDFPLDYEPDTFGHSLNVPEALAQGGVKYYYHCRGDEDDLLYRWEAPSGRSLLVYREPNWYLGTVEYDMCAFVPSFCQQVGTDTAMRVYGVGDHGGGPTRRDILRILDMASWPIFPTISMGRYREFFAAMEKAKNIPVKTGELNFVFTGCYTTQSRIKAANRLGEGALYEAEALCTMADFTAGAAYHKDAFESCWRDVLFGQFHDILPGSGIIDTREYALGRFQEVMAHTGTLRAAALRAVASRVDTSAFIIEEGDETTSEGAGVGYGIERHRIPQTERGRGLSRLYHIFNPAPFDRKEAITLTVWDWPGDIRRVAVADAEGHDIGCQALQLVKQHYMLHEYEEVVLLAQVPALGHATYRLYERQDGTLSLPPREDPRVHQPFLYCLENDCVRAEFDETHGSVISLTDKKTGKKLCDDIGPAGLFRLIDEDAHLGMTSWVVGPYQKIEDTPGKTVVQYGATGPIYNSVIVTRQMEKSELRAEISLAAGSSFLQYDVTCKWECVGTSQITKQLAFCCPAAYETKSYVYDVPFGTIERESRAQDVPALSWGIAKPCDDSPALCIVTDSKYGFRGDEDTLQVTLLRSSTDPDPIPEVAVHHFTLWLGAVDGSDLNTVNSTAFALNHPFSYVSDVPHEGDLPLYQRFMAVQNAAVSAIKKAEDDKGIIVRIYDARGWKSPALRTQDLGNNGAVDGENMAIITLPDGAKNAYLCDTHENIISSLPIDGRTVSLGLKNNESATVRITF